MNAPRVKAIWSWAIHQFMRWSLLVGAVLVGWYLWQDEPEKAIVNGVLCALVFAVRRGWVPARHLHGVFVGLLLASAVFIQVTVHDTRMTVITLLLIVGFSASELIRADRAHRRKRS